MSPADASVDGTTWPPPASKALVMDKTTPQREGSHAESKLALWTRLEGVPLSPDNGLGPTGTIQHTAGEGSSQHMQHLFVEPSPTILALTTEGYRLALNNRLDFYKLLPGGVLDIRVWPPIFIYDVLMLPGTLAQHLGKESETDIIDRMTPAILQGHRAMIHPESKEPGLVISEESTDGVHGLIIFGRGKDSRSRIHKHYRRNNARRVKAAATIETMVPVPRTARSPGEPRWTRQATTLMADVCVWQSHNTQDFSPSALTPWTFEDFITGVYG